MLSNSRIHQLHESQLRVGIQGNKPRSDCSLRASPARTDARDNPSHEHTSALAARRDDAGTGRIAWTTTRASRRRPAQSDALLADRKRFFSNRPRFCAMLTAVGRSSYGNRQQECYLAESLTMAPLFRILTQFLVFVCAVASTSAAEAKAPPKAQEHMDAGLAYVDDPGGPRYEEAYREFHAAYEIYPAYQLLANIGTCALYLERDAEAIDAYERYLEKAVQKDIPVAKRSLVEEDIKTLKASVVQLNISVSPTTVTLIDERFTAKGDSVVNRYEVTDGKVVLGIHPGNHRVTAHQEGFDDQQWEIDAKPATTHTHEFRLAKKEAPLASTPAAS